MIDYSEEEEMIKHYTCESNIDKIYEMKWNTAELVSFMRLFRKQKKSNSCGSEKLGFIKGVIYKGIEYKLDKNSNNLVDKNGNYLDKN